MSRTQTRNEETEKQIELLRMKKTMDLLRSATSKSNTSMISLYITPGSAQLIRANKMINEELGIATNIKSRV